MLRFRRTTRRRIAGQRLDLDPPVEEDDDLVNELIEHDPAFPELLAKSIASPREPFRFERFDAHQAGDQ